MSESSLEKLMGTVPERSRMSHIEENLHREFVAAESGRAARNEAVRPLRQSMVDSARDVIGPAVRTVHELAAANALTKRTVPVAPRATPQIHYAATLAATRTAPYDWSWQWHATNGDANSSAWSSDNTTGKMSAFENNGDGSGSASGAVGVGIYFRPPSGNVGTLSFTANPAFDYLWWTYNTLDSSHSDAWIGMYVGAYDLNGTFLNAPVDTKYYLWNESHSGFDSPDGRGSSSGYPLSASMFVNGNEYYELWVWCGGSASGDGDHTFWGSYGGSSLDAMVPWMHWEYFGGS